tara:strand:+ start:235 stop:519 length:285 start_codon:yes stop_codon:yes gene_type:complete
MKKLFLLSLILSSPIFAEDYQGRFCELNAYTESGKNVYGQFYMYSNNYGEASGAFTEDNETVFGDCFRYSGRVCKLENAYTQDGEVVYGLCNIL